MMRSQMHDLACRQSCVVAMPPYVPHSPVKRKPWQEQQRRRNFGTNSYLRAPSLKTRHGHWSCGSHQVAGSKQLLGSRLGCAACLWRGGHVLRVGLRVRPQPSEAGTSDSNMDPVREKQLVCHMCVCVCVCVGGWVCVVFVVLFSLCCCCCSFFQLHNHSSSALSRFHLWALLKASYPSGAFMLVCTCTPGARA